MKELLMVKETAPHLHVPTLLCLPAGFSLFLTVSFLVSWLLFQRSPFPSLQGGNSFLSFAWIPSTFILLSFFQIFIVNELLFITSRKRRNKLLPAANLRENKVMPKGSSFTGKHQQPGHC